MILPINQSNHSDSRPIKSHHHSIKESQQRTKSFFAELAADNSQTKKTKLFCNLSRTLQSTKEDQLVLQVVGPTINKEDQLVMQAVEPSWLTTTHHKPTPRTLYHQPNVQRLYQQSSPRGASTHHSAHQHHQASYLKSEWRTTQKKKTLPAKRHLYPHLLPHSLHHLLHLASSTEPYNIPWNNMKYTAMRSLMASNKEVLYISLSATIKSCTWLSLHTTAIYGELNWMFLISAWLNHRKGLVESFGILSSILYFEKKCFKYI